MGEHVGGEQRAGCAIVEPARGDEPDRRLHDVDRAVPLSEPNGIGAGHRGDLHRFEDAAAVRLGAEIEPQRRVDIAGVAGLDIEMPRERLDVIDRHEFVEAQRKQRQRQAWRDQRFDLRADCRLVLAKAGVDQHRRVALRDEVAVRHRIAACACGVRADATVERKGVLQRVELAFVNCGDSAGKAARVASFLGGVLGQDGHGASTLPGAGGEGNSKVACIGRAEIQGRVPAGRNRC